VKVAQQGEAKNTVANQPVAADGSGRPIWRFPSEKLGGKKKSSRGKDKTFTFTEPGGDVKRTLWDADVRSTALNIMGVRGVVQQANPDRRRFGPAFHSDRHQKRMG